MTGNSQSIARAAVSGVKWNYMGSLATACSSLLIVLFSLASSYRLVELFFLVSLWIRESVPRMEDYVVHPHKSSTD